MLAYCNCFIVFQTCMLMDFMHEILSWIASMSLLWLKFLHLFFISKPVRFSSVSKKFHIKMNYFLVIVCVGDTINKCKNQQTNKIMTRYLKLQNSNSPSKHRDKKEKDDTAEHDFIVSPSQFSLHIVLLLYLLHFKDEQHLCTKHQYFLVFIIFLSCI